METSTPRSMALANAVTMALGLYATKLVMKIRLLAAPMSWINTCSVRLVATSSVDGPVHTNSMDRSALAR
ncbi:hypothetical protein [Thiolapillus sp.]|uniref:hypothetical protein n=1 Tax=Thiolapillus sp. TaxID=2017437 RepID=UPI003AF98065